MDEMNENKKPKSESIVTFILLIIPLIVFIIAEVCKGICRHMRTYVLTGDDTYAAIMQTSINCLELFIFPGIILTVVGTIIAHKTYKTGLKVIGIFEIIMQILVFWSFWYAGSHF